MPAGRPTKYNTKLAQKVCAEISIGRSVGSICKADDMPHRCSIFKWLDERPEFADLYAIAKGQAADYLAEEILGIADDGTNDYVESFDQEGGVAGYKVNGEAIARSRLRVDTRKWLASKLKARKYGEKITQEHTGTNGGPIQVAEIVFNPVGNESTD